MSSRRKDRCCVPGCFESGQSHSTLHGFPNPSKDANIFRQWVYAVGGDIIALEDCYIFKNRRVCRNHFEEKFLCRNNRISNIAVPTIHLPGLLNPTKTPFDACQLRQLSTVKNVPSTSKVADLYDRQPLTAYCAQPDKANIAEKEACEPITTTAKEMDFSVAEVITNRIRKEKHVDNSTKTTELDVSVRTKAGTKVRRVTKRIKLSKEEDALHKKLIALKVKISKYRNKMLRQKMALKAGKNIFGNPQFIKTMNSWTTSAKLLTLLQFREHKKREKGRRFTKDEKIISLTMMKQSPKAYRFLRKIFILPSIQILKKLLSKCSLKPGINKSIFKQLKKRSEKMPESHKLCSLMFDEMQLKAGIMYNERKDSIIGFVTDGQNTKKVLADHAQVFMIRGIVKNYKQPVAYTFSAGATKGVELAIQIKQIIKELQQAGFKVMATICDQGTNNRLAIKYLQEETSRDFLKNYGQRPVENIFCINGEEIVPLYDPPHLLKGIRNNLITKDLKYQMEGKECCAKWNHLEMLLNENPIYKNIRLMPKLTENHIVPAKIKKMKVKYASQIFSRTVSSNMGYLAEKGILPKETQETADLLLLMDNLFDSVNGSYGKNKNAKPLLGPVTPKSAHMETWRKAEAVLNTMKFESKSGKIEAVPTIQGWINTLKGLKLLVKNLERQGITSVYMRHFNQDPIENFFGAIRSHGYRNNSPTTQQFESAFATLLINNLTSVHAPGSNCEKDDSECLANFIINEDCYNGKNKSNKIDVDIYDIMDITIVPLASKTDLRIMAPLEYISGYFLKKLKTNVYKKCKECDQQLSDLNKKEYIKYREYAGKNWLCNPSNNLINCISEIQDITDFVLKKYIEIEYIKEYIKLMIIAIIKFDFINCNKHKEKLQNVIINKVSRLFIFTYCKNINKIINGKETVWNSHDTLQKLSQQYFNKKRHYRK